MLDDRKKRILFQLFTNTCQKPYTTVLVYNISNKIKYLMGQNHKNLDPCFAKIKKHTLHQSLIIKFFAFIDFLLHKRKVSEFFFF